MTKLFLPFIFFISATIHSGAQVKDYAGFDKLLKKVEHKDSITRIEIETKRIERNFFADKNKVKTGIDSLPSWRFMYGINSGWRHVVGSKAHYHNTKFRDTLAGGIVLSGKQLVSIFGLTEPAPMLDPLNTSPRDHYLFSGSRYASNFSIMSEDSRYLLIKMIHSYPHGNQTSWYTETKLYFVREK